jgi:zinc transporter 1/2/3
MDPVECALESIDMQNYDVEARVWALFGVFAASVSGVFIPMALKKWQSFESVRPLLKMFGAGIIFCTAIVHMLVPSIALLSDSCLPPAFLAYAAIPGLLFMAGFMMMQFIQIITAQIVRPLDCVEIKVADSSEVVCAMDRDDIETLQSHAAKQMPIPEKSASPAFQNDGGHAHGLLLLRNPTLSLYMLELGLCSHSILIGLTLGTMQDSFWTFFFAIMIHQFFEGVALSVVCSESKLKTRSLAIVLVLVYSLSTPLGVLVGIMLRHSCKYNC